MCDLRALLSFKKRECQRLTSEKPNNVLFQWQTKEKMIIMASLIYSTDSEQHTLHMKTNVKKKKKVTDT